jgi:hypothetical protein
LSAVGFKSIEKRRKDISEILRRITMLPDSFFCHKNLVEQYGYAGDDFGLIVYGTRQENDTVKVRRWNAFARSDEAISIERVDFERFPNGDVFAYCEHSDSGQEFEFRLNNVTEYNAFIRGTGRRELASCRANVAGLCEVGSVLFPVLRDEDAERERESEAEIKRDLIRRAREGDEDAERELYARAEAMAEAVRERFRDEDILSVLEGYLLPFGDKDSAFAALGDIISFEKKRNRITREYVYSLKLNVTGVPLSALVNAHDLVGMPMNGMRFMGVCSLQGTIDFGGASI